MASPTFFQNNVHPRRENGLRLTWVLTLRGVERGDIGLHAELHAGRLARQLDDHAVIAVRLLQKPS
jgi:hypothetical protein